MDKQRIRCEVQVQKQGKGRQHWKQSMNEFKGFVFLICKHKAHDKV